MKKGFFGVLFLTVFTAINCFADVYVSGQVSKAQISISTGKLRVKIDNTKIGKKLWVEVPSDKVIIDFDRRVTTTIAKYWAKDIDIKNRYDFVKIGELIILTPTKDLQVEWQDKIAKVLNRLRNPLPEIIE